MRRFPVYFLIAVAAFFTALVLYKSVAHILAADQMSGDGLSALATLLGATVALAAAWIAIRPVHRQLQEARLQSALATASSLRLTTHELEELKIALTNLVPGIFMEPENIRISIKNNSIDLYLDSLRRCSLEFNKYAISTFRLRSTFPIEDNLGSSLNEVYNKIGDCQTLSANHLNRSQRGHIEWPREAIEYQSLLVQSYGEIKRADVLVSERLVATWSFIRKVEADAAATSEA